MSSMSASTSQHNQSRSLQDLKSDAAAVRKDLANLRDDAMDVGTQAAHQVAQRVKSGADQASEMAHSAGEQVKMAHKSMCNRVAKHPTAAVLVALGAGAILGRMLWR